MDFQKKVTFCLFKFLKCTQEERKEKKTANPHVRETEGFLENDSNDNQKSQTNELDDF